MSRGRTTSISIIIATRDRAEVLAQCLTRVMMQKPSPTEIIVVDNSPDPRSTLVVLDQFPGTRFIRMTPSKRNPALMRNKGIEASCGDILAFIDDDTLVSPGWVQAIAEAFVEPDVAGVTGRVIEADAPEVSTAEIGRFSPRGEITMNFNNIIDRPVSVGFLYGCNMVFRREALARIGLLDPWLVMAYEDTELGMRAAKQGQRLLFWPHVEVQHLKWKRPDGVVRRSNEFDVASLFRSARSLAYLCVTHFGLRRDFAKVAFINLPKGAVRSFVDQPSAKNLLRVPTLVAASLIGYGMAGLRTVGIHRPPAFTMGKSGNKE